MPPRIAEIAFNVPVDSVFDYLVEDHLRDEIRPGLRVCAPFGPRRLTGYCVTLKDRSSFKRLKPLLDVLDPQVSLSEPLMELARCISQTCLEPLGVVLEAMLPGAVRKRARAQKVRTVRLCVTPEETRSAADALATSYPKQAAMLRVLAQTASEMPLAALAAAAGTGTSVASTLARKGLAVILMRESDEAAIEEMPAVPHPAPARLTQPQQAALAAFRKARQAPARGLLIHGVTASGKTEVYLQAIDEVVRDGRQAIVLVPEISLTPQTLGRFGARFERVAVLHSALTEAQRRREWLRIARGEADVVVGARSAVFAPTRRLGIIVIDEEHEPSFKQSSSPRYHAREAALARGRIENVPVLMGTATPSLESHHLARSGQIDLVRMPDRIDDLPLPSVEVVDMRTETAGGRKPRIISRKLELLIERRLKRSEQVMLFLNRRGFSTFILCRRCGLTLRCPQCAVAVRYHRGDKSVLCHYCGYTAPAPRHCPDCGAEVLHFGGTGTEKVAEEVRRFHPEARIARMDSDTMKTRRDYYDTLGAFGRGEIDVLVGTQMIAKGLDFPNLTLVGIVSADAGLIAADFRAAERTFQLIEQVSGRTGRTKMGYVVLQTHAAETTCILRAAAHDYDGFAAEELASREATGYPPFGKLIRVLASGPTDKTVGEAIHHLAEALRRALGERGTVLGPVRAPLSRLQGKFRWQLMVKMPLDTPADLLREPLRNRRGRQGVSFAVDVDPHEML